MITYDSPEKRFADQLLKNAEIRCLQAAIAELTRRLDALELPKAETPVADKPSEQIGTRAHIPKRRGRKPLSPEVKEQRRIAKEERLQRLLARPEIAALTEALNGKRTLAQGETNGLGTSALSGSK